MISQTEHPLFKYLEKVTSAVGCLRKDNHLEAALVLIYAAVDHVAWLADEKNKGERIDSAGFEAWVQKYMLDKNQNLLLGATSKDLWGARCGILHTGAPENDASRASKAKQIYYYVKLIPNSLDSTIDSAGILYLSHEQLGSAFAAGVVWFLEDLLTNPERDRQVCAKLARMLVFKQS